jgi:membrane-bound lytic murein transglycosylase D
VLDPALFPRPAELEPAIKFWTRVYTEVTTDSGYLHDPENLSIVYKSLNLRTQDLENERQRVQEILLELSTGKRNPLSPEEKAILGLWPESVSNQTLRAASNRIRWQRGQSDAFKDGLERSGAFRSYINDAAERSGVPPAIALVPHLESSFNPRARSSASAVGLWQFTRSTGQRFMRIDSIIDERMDPYIASDAAMNLLTYHYRVLGTWPLALTAYNQGVSRMMNAVRQVNSSDIAKIINEFEDDNFGFAGRNFYAQFLAVNDIEAAATRYFDSIESAEAPAYVSVRLDAFIDARPLADAIGVSIENLRAANPSLLAPVWLGAKRIPRGFNLRLPAADFSSPDSVLAGLDKRIKRREQTLDKLYEVELGDSLITIANKLGLSTDILVDLNELARSSSLRVGQQLLLPPDVERSSPIVLASNNYADGAVATRNARGPRAALPRPASMTRPRSFTMRGEPSTPSLRLEQPFLRSSVAETTVSERKESPASLSSPTPSISPTLAITANGAVLRSSEPTTASALLSDEIRNLLNSDPSNYEVAPNGSIVAQASETLAQLANWLGLRTWELESLNDLTIRDKLAIGETLQLNFRKVSIRDFDKTRRNYHAQLQRAFFEDYEINGAEEYEVTRGDNIQRIAELQFSVPLWLIRQYNPNLDLTRVRVGQKITVPIVTKSERN